MTTDSLLGGNNMSIDIRTKKHCTKTMLISSLDNNGAIIDTRKYKRVSKIKGGFSKMYSNDYIKTQELTIRSKTDLLIWNWFITNTQDNNLVYLNSTKLADKMQISRQAIHKFIKKAIEAGFIRRINRGEYQINPFIYIPHKITSEEDLFLMQKGWKEYEKQKNNC